jgi:hypothetical protein
MVNIGQTVEPAHPDLLHLNHKRNISIYLIGGNVFQPFGKNYLRLLNVAARENLYSPVQPCFHPLGVIG